jgi:hypothetical protein
MKSIAYDCSLKRPACILIQAVMGGTVSSQELHDLFPVGSWLLHPTADMKVYQVTEDQLVKLGQITHNAHPEEVRTVERRKRKARRGSDAR